MVKQYYCYYAVHNAAKSKRYCCSGDVCGRLNSRMYATFPLIFDDGANATLLISMANGSRRIMIITFGGAGVIDMRALCSQSTAG